MTNITEIISGVVAFILAVVIMFPKITAIIKVAAEFRKLFDKTKDEIQLKIGDNDTKSKDFFKYFIEKHKANLEKRFKITMDEVEKEEILEDLAECEEMLQKLRE